MSRRHSRGASPTISGRAPLRGIPSGSSQTATEPEATVGRPEHSQRRTTEEGLHARQILGKLRTRLDREKDTPLNVYRHGDVLFMDGAYWQVHTPSLVTHTSSNGYLPYLAFHVLLLPLSDPSFQELAEDPASRFPGDVYNHGDITLPVRYDLICPPSKDTKVQVGGGLIRIGDVEKFQILDPTANHPTLEVQVKLLSREAGDRVVNNGIPFLETLFPNPYTARRSERIFPVRHQLNDSEPHHSKMYI